MTDFKIRAPNGPNPATTATGPKSTNESTKAFELAPESSTVNEVNEVPEQGTDPASLVQGIREGRIDLDQAIDIMIEGVLNGRPATAASESLREEIRNALTELVREDPTLSTLASAMKR